MLNTVKVAQSVETVAKRLAHGDLEAEVETLFHFIFHTHTHRNVEGEVRAIDECGGSTHAQHHVWGNAAVILIFRPYAIIEEVEFCLCAQVHEVRLKLIVLSVGEFAGAIVAVAAD